ncbi:DNA primase small subunit [Sitodiplosis mosellana]|uniref:DNA primase small subunit n=1 Tax=Sitodiplosis mosellana TaxID=263140 RepID=UPI0024451BF0|nr:DNA primase small subunit [Sitodiplosis mosellana]
MVENKAEEYSQQDLQDMLKIYYKRLFPRNSFFRWLTYSHTEPSIFQNREFSFTLADEVYIRYLSYENLNEFENDLFAKNPFKIDIGAVMTIRPKDHRVGNVQPTQRELVFDIDMTDYDEVRTCCSGADVCQKCWKFMVIACRILDESLREDFNFEHILWVFSGRRGIHCWVCDKIARHLDNKNRNAVAEYLNLFTSQNSTSRVSLPGDRMHHSMKRAHRIVEAYFDEICLNDQNIFGSSEGRKKLLELIQDENTRKELEKSIMSVEAGDSKTVWDIVKRYVIANRNVKKLKFLIEEIQMSILCPRLDISVSKTANHLLKAPFCVHPKTGKVCVPFNPSAVSKFDPTTVPKLRQLLIEVDQFDKKDEENGSEKSRIALTYRKTAMYKSVIIFEEFLRKLESSHKNAGTKLEISDAKMEF